MAIKLNEAIEAAKGCGGVQSNVAKRLGVARSTVSGMCKKWPKLKEAIDAERQVMVDVAEMALLQQIRDGNMTAIIFYLKTMGADRGYIENRQIIQIQKELDKVLDILEAELTPEQYRNVLKKLSK